MPLLNYTTTVDALKSLTEIQSALAKGGARRVMIEYHSDGRPASVVFQVDTAYGLRGFVLPANPTPVLEAMRRSSVPPRFLNKPQAERVAWRILKDWLEAQLAIVQTGMVSLDQVMLPYMADDSDGRTVYEVYRDAQLALPAGDRGGEDR